MKVDPIDAVLFQQSRSALTGASLVTLVIFVLDRLKPRCGQYPARGAALHHSGGK